MSLALADSVLSAESHLSKKILVVEDDYALREALEDTLTLAQYQVVSAKNAESAVDVLAQQNDIVMIVSDVNMGAMSGHDLLQHVKKSYAHIPMLLITAYASIRDSVAAIRHGAIDYLVKPFEPKALLDIVSHQLSGIVASDAKAPVAEDSSSQQLLQLATRVAQSESTVLILGESGTGKEVLARYIHQQSPRATQPFIAINCAAIPENMLEAMLFGHEKGAYTGAHASAPGKFEQANGGTLLLDEISEMDIGLQAKLLRVLQEREVERLGGRKTIELDVRVIATSNRDMLQQISEGKFREDLYYRLSVLPLFWQPLRDRPNDIIPLASQLLTKHATKQKRLGVQLSACAQQALLQYNWPGNVRELDNVIQRALILQMGNIIATDDLGLNFSANTIASVQQTNNHTPLASMANTNYCPPPLGEPLAVNNTEYDRPKQLGDDLQKHEFDIIVETLKLEGGSRKNTAKRLGISPRTLRYKLAKMREVGLIVEK